MADNPVAFPCDSRVYLAAEVDSLEYKVNLTPNQYLVPSGPHGKASCDPIWLGA